MSGKVRKVNITVDIPSEVLVEFENYLSENFRLIDFRVVPDTQELYDNSATFRRLVSHVKKAKEARDKFINENN